MMTVSFKMQFNRLGLFCCTSSLLSHNKRLANLIPIVLVWMLGATAQSLAQTTASTETSVETGVETSVEASVKTTAPPISQDATTPELVNINAPAAAQSLDPQVLRDLDTQFAKVRATLEQEDAFSEVLGENYLSYGLLLKSAGRFEEARDMFMDALHITKINNGIYAIEQRPILKALFETNYALGNSEGFEDNLTRILWLERKASQLAKQQTGKYTGAHEDFYAYDMVLQLGNHYIDRFLYRTVSSEAGLEELSKAKRYFQYAVRRYGNQTLENQVPPFGELALVAYLRSKIQPVQLRSSFADNNSSRNARFLQGTNSIDHRSLNYAAGSNSLKAYLEKARRENNTEHIVTALLNMADMNLLFDNSGIALQLYKHAWEEAQQLASDHPIVASFNQPVQLPAFNYARPRQLIERKKASVFVPMQFSVDKFGRVAQMSALAPDNPHYRYASKVKRTLKRTKFRPVIKDGETIGSGITQDNVRLLVKRQKNN